FASAPASRAGPWWYSTPPACTTHSSCTCRRSSTAPASSSWPSGPTSGPSTAAWAGSTPWSRSRSLAPGPTTCASARPGWRASWLGCGPSWTTAAGTSPTWRRACSGGSATSPTGPCGGPERPKSGQDLLGRPGDLEDAGGPGPGGPSRLPQPAGVVGHAVDGVTDGHGEGVDALELGQLLDDEADGGVALGPGLQRVGVHHPHGHVGRAGDGQADRARPGPSPPGDVHVDHHRLAAPVVALALEGGRVVQAQVGHPRPVAPTGGAAGLGGAGAQQAAQPLGRLHRVAVVQHPAVVQDHSPAADPRDQVEGVGDEQDRAAPLREPADLVQALALERLVPHGQDLVDQQDVGADVDGHGEPEAHVLAGAVVLDLVVDERLQLGGGENVREGG